MTNAILIALAVALNQPAFLGNQIKIAPAGGVAGDAFGADVAIQGNVAVIGAIGVKVDGNDRAGAAYVYERSGSTWVRTATLTASDAAANDELGTAVAIDGDVIVVSGTGVSNAAGALYVYEMPAGGWADMTETAKLTASDEAMTASLGHGVALSGETIVTGAPGAGAPFTGAAYIFVKPAGGWVDGTETAKLTHADGVPYDSFGFHVDIQGETIVVGAPNRGNTGGGTQDGHGAVYVYQRPPGGWESAVQPVVLTASDGSKADFLGYSVAIDGATIVAGASNAANSGPGAQDGSGAAYVYEMPEAGWKNATQTSKLLAFKLEQGSLFGISVAIRGDNVLIGAANREHTPMLIDGEGAGYLFVRPDVGWSALQSENEKLTASDALPKRLFGYNLDISEDWLLIGAPLAGPGDMEPGSVYFIELDDDGDGVANYLDPCPGDAAKLEPGVCGCGTPDVDSDGDGNFDCNDACAGEPDLDTDGDGVMDCIDNCVDSANADQADADGDGIGDACEDAISSAQAGACCGGGIPLVLPLLVLRMGKWRNGRRVKRRDLKSEMKSEVSNYLKSEI